MLPKRRFWNVEKYVDKTFCRHFRGTFSPNRVVGSMKSAYKMSCPNIFRPSKIFVWGAYNRVLFFAKVLARFDTQPSDARPQHTRRVVLVAEQRSVPSALALGPYVHLPCADCAKEPLECEIRIQVVCQAGKQRPAQNLKSVVGTRRQSKQPVCWKCVTPRTGRS